MGIPKRNRNLPTLNSSFRNPVLEEEKQIIKKPPVQQHHPERSVLGTSTSWAGLSVVPVQFQWPPVPWVILCHLSRYWWKGVGCGYCRHLLQNQKIKRWKEEKNPQIPEAQSINAALAKRTEQCRQCILLRFSTGMYLWLLLLPGYATQSQKDLLELISRTIWICKGISHLNPNHTREVILPPVAVKTHLTDDGWPCPDVVNSSVFGGLKSVELAREQKIEQMGTSWQDYYIRESPGSFDGPSKVFPQIYLSQPQNERHWKFQHGRKNKR